MGDSLFDIFGDHDLKKNVKNVTRHPFSNIENMGKTVSNGPLKPNEPLKTVKKIGEIKKSFLSNTGKAFQSTPVRTPFASRAVNVGSMIYSDVEEKSFIEINIEEFEFTKPAYKQDNFYTDPLKYLGPPEPEPLFEESPPNTPPPSNRRPSLEFNCSYQDEFFTDDFSNEAFPDDDLDSPELY